MKFKIYHPVGGVFNTFCEEGIYSYELVGELFYKSQNEHNPVYDQFNVRSTSVGDIIVDENNIQHMVMGVGYKQVKERLVN
jgi:hypothetical protein